MNDKPLKIILLLLVTASLVLLGFAIFDTPIIGELNWFYVWFQAPLLGATLALQHHIQDMTD